MMSQIDSWHWKISTGRHFQNGHHNTAKIQHCPISSKFDMWVDNDVPNWFPRLTNFYSLPFSKWLPQYRTNSTLSDFNDISYVGRLGQKKKGVFSDCMVFRIRVGRTGFFFFFEFLILFFLETYKYAPSSKITQVCLFLSYYSLLIIWHVV
jgi:hypothetical protein